MKKMLLQMTSASLQPVPSLKLTQVAKNHFAFATAFLWHYSSEITLKLYLYGKYSI
jgi:hypothetical protein